MREARLKSTEIHIIFNIIVYYVGRVYLMVKRMPMSVEAFIQTPLWFAEENSKYWWEEYV